MWLCEIRTGLLRTNIPGRCPRQPLAQRHYRGIQDFSHAGVRIELVRFWLHAHVKYRLTPSGNTSQNCSGLALDLLEVFHPHRTPHPHHNSWMDAVVILIFMKGHSAKMLYFDGSAVSVAKLDKCCTLLFDSPHFFMWNQIHIVLYCRMYLQTWKRIGQGCMIRNPMMLPQHTILNHFIWGKVIYSIHSTEDDLKKVWPLSVSRKPISCVLTHSLTPTWLWWL